MGSGLEQPQLQDDPAKRAISKILVDAGLSLSPSLSLLFLSCHLTKSLHQLHYPTWPGRLQAPTTGTGASGDNLSAFPIM